MESGRDGGEKGKASLQEVFWYENRARERVTVSLEYQPPTRACVGTRCANPGPPTESPNHPILMS